MSGKVADNLSQAVRISSIIFQQASSWTIRQLVAKHQCLMSFMYLGDNSSPLEKAADEFFKFSFLPFSDPDTKSSYKTLKCHEIQAATSNAKSWSHLRSTAARCWL